MRYLLPCETCSGRAELDYGADEFFVACTRCGLRTSDHKYTADAVSQWNFRPGHEAAGSGGGQVRPARPRGVDGGEG